MEDDGDDRWESFEDHGLTSQLGVKAKQEQKPELGDYLRVILTHKSPRDRQERKYKVCFPVIFGERVLSGGSICHFNFIFLIGLNLSTCIFFNSRAYFGRVIKVVSL